MPLPILPPSANDRSVTFIIPKNKDPYYVQWYQNTKNQGEDVNAFLLRNLNKLVRQYFIAQVTITDADNVAKSTQADTLFLEK